MKKMFYQVIIGVVCCTVLASGPAFAFGVGGLKGLAGGSTPAASTLSGQDFEAMFKLFTEADDLLQKSVNSLVKMVGNKEVIEELDRKMAAAKEIKDPKEREAAITKVREAQVAALQAASEQQATTERLAALSADQKKLAADSAYNFMLAGLKDMTVVEAANGIISKVSANPTAAMSFSGDISRTKDIAATLPPQATKISQIGSNLIKMMKSGEIEVAAPKSATEPAKDVNI